MEEEFEVEAARTHCLFREVNERVELLSQSFDIVDTRVCVCECARSGCVEQIVIDHAAYRLLREDPRRFIVAPSAEHVFTDIENVVEQTDRYWIIEKSGVAGEERSDRQRRLAAEPTSREEARRLTVGDT